MEGMISAHSTTLAVAQSPLSLLEDGLEALDLGLGVFDDDLLLVECNRLFQRLRNYPANLCQPGVPLADLLAHDRAHDQLVGRNGDDPVDTWLDRATSGQRHVAEDALTDGRVITTAMTPMGHGGLLLTFADITEKSLAERELRASKEWYDLVTEASSLRPTISLSAFVAANFKRLMCPAWRISKQPLVKAIRYPLERQYPRTPSRSSGSISFWKFAECR